MRIIDIVARWPGSTHDQLIFNNSALKHRFEEGEFNEGGTVAIRISLVIILFLYAVVVIFCFNF